MYGLRPVAYITTSVSTSWPLVSVLLMPPSTFSSRVCSQPRTIFMPRLPISISMWLRTSLSKPRSTLGPRYISVVSTPRPLKMPANSSAM